MTLRFKCQVAKNECSIKLIFDWIDKRPDFNNVTYTINAVHIFHGGKIDFENKRLIFSEPFKIYEWTNGINLGKEKTINFIRIEKYTMRSILDSKNY